MTGAQLSLRTLCSVSMVHNCIYVQLNRAQSVVHNQRGVRLVSAQLYPRVACPVDMVHTAQLFSCTIGPCPVGCAQSISCTVVWSSISTIPKFWHIAAFLKIKREKYKNIQTKSVTTSPGLPYTIFLTILKYI